MEIGKIAMESARKTVMMVLVSLKARTLLLGRLIWHGRDSAARRGPVQGRLLGRVRQSYNTVMAKKWELPEKTFDKGRRPRRHLTADGRKALRHLRLTMVAVAVFFALLFAWVIEFRPRETPVQPHNTGAGTLR